MYNSSEDELPDHICVNCRKYPKITSPFDKSLNPYVNQLLEKHNDNGFTRAELLIIIEEQELCDECVQDNIENIYNLMHHTYSKIKCACCEKLWYCQNLPNCENERTAFKHPAINNYNNLFKVINNEYISKNGCNLESQIPKQKIDILLKSYKINPSVLIYRTFKYFYNKENISDTNKYNIELFRVRWKNLNKSNKELNHDKELKPDNYKLIIEIINKIYTDTFQNIRTIIIDDFPIFENWIIDDGFIIPCSNCIDEYIRNELINLNLPKINKYSNLPSLLNISLSKITNDGDINKAWEEIIRLGLGDKINYPNIL